MLKWIHAEIKMELNNPRTQTESSTGRCTSRLYQAENRISGLKEE